MNNHIEECFNVDPLMDFAPGRFIGREIAIVD